MKKSISIMTVLLLGMSAFGAGLSQLTLSISTQGPDYYADGNAVQVGEKYLLVYVGEGAAFAGIKSDGSLVDPAGKIVTLSTLGDKNLIKIEAHEMHLAGLACFTDHFPRLGEHRASLGHIDLDFAGY